MPKDKQGKYQPVPNPSIDPNEDDFEIDSDPDNITASTGTTSYPRDLNLDPESLQSYKDTFPSTPRPSHKTLFHQLKERAFGNGSKKRKIIVYFSALIVVCLIGSLFLRFQSPEETGGYKDVESTKPELNPETAPTELQSPPPQQNDENGSVASNTESKPPITMDDLRKGIFSPRHKQIKFINPSYLFPEYTDSGLYYHFDDLDSQLKAVKLDDLNYKQTLASGMKLNYDDEEYQITRVIPNLEVSYSILVTDVKKQWRHSSLGYYWLYQHATGNIYPIRLSDDGVLQKLSYVHWSPRYNYLSYVLENNIYVFSISTFQSTQITFDGSEVLLYGKPDWVYEEEVSASDSASWWAPDESNLVFLKLDDSKVETYQLQYYAKQQDGEEEYNLYPETKELRYPKPGTANPQASLHIYDLEKDEAMEIPHAAASDDLGSDVIVDDAFFLDSATFIIKETDRESKRLLFRKYDIITKETSAFWQIDAEKEYSGWIQKQATPLLILHEDGSYGFVDTQSVKGYNHLIYFSNLQSDPVPLTSGEWEVSKDSPLSYNPQTKEVYYFSNQGPLATSSMDQLLYSVNLATHEIKLKFNKEDDATKGAYYSGQFSGSGKYAQLNYEGPGIPYSVIYNLETEETVLELTTGTQEVQENLNKYGAVERKLHRIEVDVDSSGKPVVLNVIETLPPNFSPDKKYPLLIHHYAGPGSQVVFNKFDYGFEDTISSTLQAVVLFIEPRGTGGQGWSFRSWVTKKIGFWEPRDITTITKKWIEKEDTYIDKERVAIWGWSYGGFTTLNTLQYDAGEVFKYGVAVAPVTDWRLYDSIYTERYMGLPSSNIEGYEISQINNFENLKKVKKFLVMHGSADDNVHLQNTMTLMDELDLNGLINYEMHIFPDSDHSISFHGANDVVYSKITAFIGEAFQGKFV